MFLSEWHEFLSATCLQEKRNLMTAYISMLLKSPSSLTCFGACFLPGWAKDLSAPRYKQCMRTVLLTYLYLFAVKNSKFVLFLLLMCAEWFKNFWNNLHCRSGIVIFCFHKIRQFVLYLKLTLCSLMDCMKRSGLNLCTTTERVPSHIHISASSRPYAWQKGDTPKATSSRLV